MSFHKFFEQIGMMTTMLIWGFIALGIASVLREKILARKKRTLEEDEESDKAILFKRISPKTEDEMLKQSFDGYEDRTFDHDWEKRNCSDEERAIISFERRKTRTISINSRLLTMYVQKIIDIEEELAELFPLLSIEQDIENQFLSTNVSLEDCGYWKDEIHYQNYSNHIVLKRELEISRAFYLGELKNQVNLGCECLRINSSELPDAIYLISRHYLGLNTLRNRLVRDYFLLQYHCWHKKKRKERMTKGEEYFAKMHGARLLSKKLELELPINYESTDEEQIIKI